MIDSAGQTEFSYEFRLPQIVVNRKAKGNVYSNSVSIYHVWCEEHTSFPTHETLISFTFANLTALGMDSQTHNTFRRSAILDAISDRAYMEREENVFASCSNGCLITLNAWCVDQIQLPIFKPTHTYTHTFIQLI